MCQPHVFRCDAVYILNQMRAESKEYWNSLSRSWGPLLDDVVCGVLLTWQTKCPRHFFFVIPLGRDDDGRAKAIGEVVECCISRLFSRFTNFRSWIFFSVHFRARSFPGNWESWKVFSNFPGKRWNLIFIVSFKGTTMRRPRYWIETRIGLWFRTESKQKLDSFLFVLLEI